MMLALVAAAALASTPRALPNADSGLHIPKLDGTSGLVAFMNRAGERSVMVRPSTWFGDSHPVFRADFSQPDTLEDIAVDAAGFATLSTRKHGRMTCHGVTDPKKFDARVEERLGVVGEVWKGKVGGLAVVGATRFGEKTLSAAVARRGKVACAVGSRKDARALLDELVAATGAVTPKGPWAQTKGLRGEAFLVMGNAVVGLTGKADALTVDGRAFGLSAPKLRTGSQSPFAAFAPEGLAVMRASVQPGEVGRSVRSLVGPLSGLCKGCPREGVAKLEAGLSAQLTGQLALLVHSAQVRGRMKTDADRFFAARHVWLAEVKDADAVRKALAPVGQFGGAQPLEAGAGWVIPLEPGRELRVVQSGKTVLLANDEAALKAALAGLGGGRGKHARGLTVQVDPQRAHRTLSGISLFDVVGASELAGLLAVSTELGPVLEITRGVEGWADSEGARTYRFGALLTLAPPT